jgi:hypothetical protein
MVALCLQGIAAGAYPPGICALSFGVVGCDAFPVRAARNEMMEHAGAVITAGLLPILLVQPEEDGWNTFFATIMCLLITAGVLLAMIWKSDIADHGRHVVLRRQSITQMPPRSGSLALRGLHRVSSGESSRSHSGNYATIEFEDDDVFDAPVVPLSELVRRREILLLIGAITGFYLADAAMLPQLGYKLDLIYNDNSTAAGGSLALGGQTIELNGKNSIGMVSIISQLVMIPVAFGAGRLTRSPWVGNKRLLVFGCLVQIARGLWIGLVDQPTVLLWSAVLDGVATGLFGVCSILYMSDLTESTGQFAAMQGVVATCMGLGSSASHGISGWTSQEQGVDFTMFLLAGFALIPLGLLLLADDPVAWRLSLASTEDTRQKLLPDKNTRDSNKAFAATGTSESDDSFLLFET